MLSRSISLPMALAMLLAVSPAIHAQTFSSLPPIPFENSGPVIRARAELLKPFTVAGERAVVLGQQDGTFEAWALPVKLLSHMAITAQVEGYNVPIDVNQQAASIEVRPDRTIITYSHIAFTVRQIMFASNDAAEGEGPVVLYEFDCLHPTDFLFRFTPELRWMWPERNEGVPNAEWVRVPGAKDGFYVLHADYPNLAAGITMPGAEPGILAPYQERPQVHAVELKQHIDPARDHGRLFPLLMAVGTTQAAANTAALGASLARMNQNIPLDYHAHAEAYKANLANYLSISTPNKALNEAFQWAVVSIEQLKTHVPLAKPPARDAGPEETALVAGYYASADSARPGFGWFFGRDALYTLYAVNSYGDFALARNELDFLTHRQRGDGKIMHEYSQTAADMDWQAFPYMYAAADSTALYLLAMADYVKTTGDIAFLQAHREALEKAWAFEIDPAHDTDHDGIFDNSQGTGWVESWPDHMPHQEIYLALLDQQASAAMAILEKLLGDSGKADAAAQRAGNIAKTIETEYYDPAKGCYAFSRNGDGSLDRASTVYPALAWWDPTDPSAKSVLAHPDGCLQQFAAHTLATDWGLRDVSTEEMLYDGMSYHQGSVWPLFTGWAALAEYRANQPLAGYQMLMENANLTWAQDLGADTELLSGDFYVPMGRSTSHQLWSSAMVITPALRGLFGISVDAQSGTITVDPHLPADWDHAEVKNLHVGKETLNLSFVQSSGDVRVSVQGASASAMKLRSTAPGAKTLSASKVSIPRNPVEVVAAITTPEPGHRTQLARVLSEESGDRKLTLTVEGRAGTSAEYEVLVLSSKVSLHAQGAELSEPAKHDARSASAEPEKLTIHFQEGDGWKTSTVTLIW